MQVNSGCSARQVRYHLSQFSKIVPIKNGILRYAVCGRCLCIKSASCYSISCFLILLHDFSGPSARGVLKGFICAESQPIGVFHQAGVGALDDFPSVVVGQPHQFQNLFAVHPIFRKDSFLCPNDHIDQWNFSFVTDEKVQWEVILRHTLICAKRLPIFA